MPNYMHNVRTGEIREVEEQSDEFHDLRMEVYDPGDGSSKPVWEQQGEHAARRLAAERERRDNERANEDRDASAFGPEREPHKQLTPAEVESGLTSWEEKEKQLDKQFGRDSEPNDIAARDNARRKVDKTEEVEKAATRRPKAAAPAASSDS